MRVRFERLSHLLSAAVPQLLLARRGWIAMEATGMGSPALVLLLPTVAKISSHHYTHDRYAVHFGSICSQTLVESVPSASPLPKPFLKRKYSKKCVIFLPPAGAPHQPGGGAIGLASLAWFTLLAD